MEERIKKVVSPEILRVYDIKVVNHPKTTHEFKFVISEKKTGIEVFETTYYNEQEINSTPSYLSELMSIATRNLDVNPRALDKRGTVSVEKRVFKKKEH